MQQNHFIFALKAHCNISHFNFSCSPLSQSVFVFSFFNSISSHNFLQVTCTYPIFFWTTKYKMDNDDWCITCIRNDTVSNSQILFMNVIRGEGAASCSCLTPHLSTMIMNNHKHSTSFNSTHSSTVTHLSANKKLYHET